MSLAFVRIGFCNKSKGLKKTKNKTKRKKTNKKTAAKSLFNLS